MDFLEKIRKLPLEKRKKIFKVSVVIVFIILVFLYFVYLKFHFQKIFEK